MTSPRATWLRDLALIVALLALVAAASHALARNDPCFANPLGRPLHADEAGQWSLLTEGRPHSETGDRFHGPALVLMARGTCALLGVDPAGLSEGGLRLIPLAFGLTLFWPVLRRGGLPAAALAALAVFPSARFIQEPVLAVALTWSAFLGMRSSEAAPGRAWPWQAAAGAFAGLALACKVTAVLYLGLFALAFLGLCRKSALGRASLVFVAAMLASWVLWQSSFLRDLPALGTWCRQFGHAFPLAAGTTAEPLRLTSFWPWALSGISLLLAGWLRWRVRAREAWGSHPADPLLPAALGAYLVHLALPYQTPWLMMTVDMVVLVILLPERLPNGGWSLRGTDGRPRLAAWLALGACVLGARWVMSARYAYAETRDEAVVATQLIRGLPDVNGLTLQVSGGNYWPLPYYLRGLRVGYGDFPEAEAAEVRWIEATGAEAPAAPGYRVMPVALRAGEVWWLLVRSDLLADAEPAR